MKYTELRIQVEHENIETVTYQLVELGITSTEIIDDTIVDEIMDKKESYEWDYIDSAVAEKKQNGKPQVCVFFEDTKDGIRQMEEVRKMYVRYEITEHCVDEEDWVNAYKEKFQTMELTDSLVVRPSWEEEAAVSALYGPEKKQIILDPGMAFGTGSHETTSLCALFLEEIGCFEKSVLDLGTGSGILAIAAARLGAPKVLGIDIDPVAVEVARENMCINQCDDVVTILEGDLVKGVDFKADIIVANLMAELLCVLAPSIPKHMEKDGCCICSGILAEKKDMVAAAFEESGMAVVDAKKKGEWVALKVCYA